MGFLVEGLAYFFVSDDVVACVDGFDHDVHGLELDLLHALRVVDDPV